MWYMQPCLPAARAIPCLRVGGPWSVSGWMIRTAGAGPARRTAVRGGVAPAPAAAPTPAAAKTAGGVVLRTLTEEERTARSSALESAKVREAEERRVAEEDARRRNERDSREKVEREASETRKRDEEERR